MQILHRMQIPGHSRPYISLEGWTGSSFLSPRATWQFYRQNNKRKRHTYQELQAVARESRSWRNLDSKGDNIGMRTLDPAESKPPPLPFLTYSLYIVFRVHKHAKLSYAAFKICSRCFVCYETCSNVFLNPPPPPSSPASGTPWGLALP